MKFEIRGSDELIHKIDDFEQAAESLQGEHSVSLESLFPDEFISAHTNFPTLEGFLTSSEFDISSQEAFEAVPDDEWDEFVKSESDFSSWQEMMEAAVALWVSNNLDLT
jgi:hypothetical protein